MQHKLFSWLVFFLLIKSVLHAEDSEAVQPRLWHSIKENFFLNYARQEAEGFEALGDWLLTPYRYLLGGSDIVQNPSGYTLVPSCHDREKNRLKTLLSVLALPFSIVSGTLIKGVSYLSPSTREAYHHFKQWHGSLSKRNTEG